MYWMYWNHLLTFTDVSANSFFSIFTCTKIDNILNFSFQTKQLIINNIPPNLFEWELNRYYIALGFYEKEVN